MSRRIQHAGPPGARPRPRGRRAPAGDLVVGHARAAPQRGVGVGGQDDVGLLDHLVAVEPLWVTGDLDFVLGRGAEVLIETARFWMELGFFSERRGGRFCLTGVTGPDEYTTVVDRSFSPEEIRRTFDYYDPLTTGDSTLSACVQSIVASAAGHPDAALRYFLDGASVDLLDSHGNSVDGLHIASCGGTWLALVAGFGGLRDFDGEVRFDPRLPAGWDRLRFRVEIRGQRLEVDMTPGATAYTLCSGTGLLIEHRGELLRLAPGVPVVRRNGGQEALPLAA